MRINLQQDPGRTNVSVLHIAHNPHLCLCAATHKSNKTVALKLNWERALLPRLLLFLRRFEITEHEQNVVIVRQLVLQWTHIAHMSDLVVLITVFTKWFKAFVLFLYQRTTRYAQSLSFTHSFLFTSHFVYLMIVETRSTPKMPVAVFTRVSFLARIWWD
jgi:hypothetical protein